MPPTSSIPSHDRLHRAVIGLGQVGLPLAVESRRKRFSILAEPTQSTYSQALNALFKELPAFSRCRAEYLSDESFRELQNVLMQNPDGGDIIQGTGGLRKIRHGDARRGKGKRGGLRIIYFWWEEGCQFWLFSVYGKDEVSDLTGPERSALKEMLKRELEARR